MPGIVALVSDLIFSSKIAATAKAAGVDFKIVRSLTTLESVWPAAPAILFIDLDLTGDDPLSAITLAKARPQPPQIVAFGSHVQVDRLAAARSAGADQVLPRSAFVNHLPELVALGAST